MCDSPFLAIFGIAIAASCCECVQCVSKSGKIILAAGCISKIRSEIISKDAELACYLAIRLYMNCSLELSH